MKVYAKTVLSSETFQKFIVVHLIKFRQIIMFTFCLQLRNKAGYTPPKLYHPYDVSFLWDNRVVVVEGFWPYSRIQMLDLQGNHIMSLAQGKYSAVYTTNANERLVERSIEKSGHA